ncbi:MAG: hypothetical protein GF375_04290 [Candidatus Omnitrophica bacterium]|nr:hypothetical protein [Candidatus Omnitrophota bacterium]MBD3269264.1 hypothetical protein [Candidatus Omnitrophota bacterium]
MKSKDITGKDVISVKEGNKLGRVRFPVIDSNHQKVIGFIVDDPDWFLETKIVLFQSIRGMEEELVTVDDDSALTAVKRLDTIHSFLRENIQLINMKIISESGKYIGRIDDFDFNHQTGKINFYKIKDSNLIIDGRDTIALGKDMLIVKEEVSTLSGEEHTPSFNEFDLSSVFEKRQADFLLGKRVGRDIRDNEGELIIPAGSMIDENCIRNMRSAGKFTELLMSVESEE